MKRLILILIFTACSSFAQVTISGPVAVSGPVTLDTFNHFIAAPTASFSVSPSGAVYTNTTITFTYTGSGATSGGYVFGDGSSSSSLTTTHIYSSISNYSVTFNVTNGGGTATASAVVNVMQSNTWRYVWDAGYIHQPIGTAPIGSNDINQATIIDPTFLVGSTLPEQANIVQPTLSGSSLQNTNVIVSLSGYSVPGTGVITQPTTNQLTQIFSGSSKWIQFGLLQTMRTATFKALVCLGKTNTGDLRDVMKLDLTNDNTGGNLITVNCVQFSSVSNGYQIEISAGSDGTYRSGAIYGPSSPGIILGVQLIVDTTGANGVANLALYNETTGQAYGYTSTTLNTGNPANGVGILDIGWCNINGESIADMAGISDTWKSVFITDAVTGTGGP